MDQRDWEADDALKRRFDEAKKLGLNEVEATAFATGQIPLHKLRALIDKGCKPKLAMKILA